MPPPLGRVVFDRKEGSLGTAVSLLVFGDRAYAVGMLAFAVYDISDPANIVRLGRKEYNRDSKRKLLGDRMGVAHEVAVRKNQSIHSPPTSPESNPPSSASAQGASPLLLQFRPARRPSGGTSGAPGSPSGGTSGAPGSPSGGTSGAPGSPLARLPVAPGSPLARLAAAPESPLSRTLPAPASPKVRTVPAPGSPTARSSAVPWSPTVRAANESPFFPEPSGSIILKQPISRASTDILPEEQVRNSKTQLSLKDGTQVASSTGLLGVRSSFKPTAVRIKPPGDTALVLPDAAFPDKSDEITPVVTEFQHRLYIAGSNGVVCYDVTRPDNIERILRFEFGTDAKHRIGNSFGVNVVVKSSRLYVAGHYGMTVFKIADLRKVRALCRVKYGVEVKERLAFGGTVSICVDKRYRCLLAGYYGMLLYDVRDTQDIVLLGCITYGNNLKTRVGNGEVGCCIMDDGTLVLAGHYRTAMWKGKEEEGKNVEGIEYVGSVRYQTRHETEIGDRVAVATKGTYIYVAGFYGATAYNVERAKFVETVGQIRYSKTLRHHVGKPEAGVDIAVTPDVVVLLGCYSLRTYDATQPKLWTPGDTSRRWDCAIM
eukprot:GEMP01030715.1.p1 GENE.GEMP01030715.1~~GEMP01030715.1.p1  ORF type:complete len:599 (+),score=109.24 GEMP01030715.1:117-1913(+)